MQEVKVAFTFVNDDRGSGRPARRGEIDDIEIRFSFFCREGYASF